MSGVRRQNAPNAQRVQAARYAGEIAVVLALRKRRKPCITGPMTFRLTSLVATAFTFCFSSADAKQIAPDALAHLPAADVVFLGELHDNPNHHENQQRAVDALKPAAFVFEMLTDAQARIITPELLQDQAALKKALDWDNGGWPDFAMYFPLFKASSGKPALGAQITRADLRAAVTGDGVTAFGQGAEKFGLTKPLPEDQQAKREALQMAAHCDALPEHLLPGMVLAQRMRDAALARAVVLAFELTGGPVAVITGNGHAQTAWGVPSLLHQAAPQLRVLSVGQFEAPPSGAVPHDLWLVTDPATRDDPCAAFR